MATLARRAFAEMLGTAFLLAAVIGSGKPSAWPPPGEFGRLLPVCEK